MTLKQLKLVISILNTKPEITYEIPNQNETISYETPKNDNIAYQESTEAMPQTLNDLINKANK